VTSLIDDGKIDEITGGKEGLRRDMFALYFENIGECIRTMEKHSMAGRQPPWLNAALEMKALSVRLGAQQMVLRSQHAIDIASNEGNEKLSLVSLIRQDVEKLQAFVKNTGT